jgi:uncharacterized protein YaiI (UPF0178 family)
MPGSDQGYPVSGGRAAWGAADACRQSPLRIPSAQNVDFLQVASGLDAADHEIEQRLGAGDLVITGDIPLAAAVVEKGGYALNPRGELYTANNVRDRLNLRDFMDFLRGSGIDTGGPPALGQGDRQSFANNLDNFLIKFARKN